MFKTRHLKPPQSTTNLLTSSTTTAWSRWLRKPKRGPNTLDLIQTNTCNCDHSRFPRTIVIPGLWVSDHDVVFSEVDLQALINKLTEAYIYPVIQASELGYNEAREKRNLPWISPEIRRLNKNIRGTGCIESQRSLQTHKLRQNWRMPKDKCKGSWGELIGSTSNRLLHQLTTKHQPAPWKKSGSI